MSKSRAIRVLIAIQARSTSKRLPNKGLAIVGVKTIIEMLLDSVDEAMSFMKRNLNNPVEFHVALVIPTGDPLKRYASRCAVVEGDEADVLSRFQKAFAFYRPDFVVRLTGDCPLLPDYVISKHIRSAIYGDLDYCTNTDPRYRTAVDGHDVEVMSKAMMRWLFQHASKPLDREHVTTLIKSSPEELKWAKIGYIIGHVDHSDVKLSVDTADDLDRVRKAHGGLETKLAAARSSGGVVFRL